MGKIVVIAGQIASGKSTLAKYMATHGFERIVTYTTRPPRDGEIDGVDYYFLSGLEEFADKAEAGFFAEHTGYTAKSGYVRYGTSKESLETPDSVKKVIVLNPEGVIQLKEAGYDIFTVYLDFEQEALMRRALQRGDTPSEIGRRIADDTRIFRGIVDLRTTNSMLLPNQIAEMIQAAL